MSGALGLGCGAVGAVVLGIVCDKRYPKQRGGGGLEGVAATLEFGLGLFFAGAGVLVLAGMSRWLAPAWTNLHSFASALAFMLLLILILAITFIVVVVVYVNMIPSREPRHPPCPGTHCRPSSRPHHHAPQPQHRQLSPHPVSLKTTP